jgi:hypothetical protein
MKLNLRAARKLETKIHLYLEENPVETQVKVRVNEGQTGEAIQERDSSRALVLAKIAEQKDLLTLKYEVRQKIAEQNSASGIDKLITQKVLNEQLVSQLKKVIASDVQLEAKMLGDTLSLAKKKLENPVADPYGNRDKDLVSTPLAVLTKEDVEAFKKSKTALSKAVEEIEDQIIGLNHTTKVELSDESVKLLQKHSLL